MSQPSSPSSSPRLTPRQQAPQLESMEDKSNDSSQAHSTTSRNEGSPQLTPQQQTLPLPASSTGNQPLQQMLRLSNPRNVCYANAGTNLLFSSPLVTTFLSALPENNAELNIVKQLATLTPNSVGHLAKL